MNFNAKVNSLTKRRLINVLMTMKLTAIVIMVALTNVSAKSYSQIMLKLKNAPVKEALQIIEHQTGFHFLYDNKDLSQVGLINVELSNVPLKQALDACFEGQPLTYRIFKNTIVLKRMESPETITVPIVQTAISGRVTDTQGEPLTGVSIMLQGTSTGTVSDNDGRYVLNVPNSAGTLVFTYVGFVAQAVTIGGRTTIDVQLEASSESLSEIVVIGYGTQRRSDLTGSITSVSAEQIEGQAFSNVNQALQGKVAGADITSTSGEPGGPVQ